MRVPALVPWILTLGVTYAVGASAQNVPKGETFEFTSYVEVESLFEKYDYTPASWRSGDRSVPRLYLTTIPERWRDRASKEISTRTKTRIFFRTLAPLVLRANELVLADRKRLEGIRSGMEQGKNPTAEDQAWMTSLAGTYGVSEGGHGAPGADSIETLLARVDIVPVSLALAQAAEESGWGTSRFAAEGNALFGQWTWGEKGITPKEQRSGLGHYKLAAFDSPLASVQGYLKNLNTSAAYSNLRAERARLRVAGEPITGTALARTLVNYSERGEAYVESLESIIRVNGLAPTDSTHLKDMRPIYLVPVDADSTGGD
jgi:Bax protein